MYVCIIFIELYFVFTIGYSLRASVTFFFKLYLVFEIVNTYKEEKDIWGKNPLSIYFRVLELNSFFS